MQMIRHNNYFEDHVQSLGPTEADEAFTVGVMDPGEYTFGTKTVEIMEVVQGAMDVTLPDGRRINVGKHETFTVPADREFSVRITEPTAYLCLYR